MSNIICDLENLDLDNLELLLACMESTLIAFINRCERMGLDAKELRDILDDLHGACDCISEAAIAPEKSAA